MAWTLADLTERLLIGSTLVEGSTLDEDEAREVLAGRTVQGHSVMEHRELLNYRSAVEWLMAEVSTVPWVSLDLVTGFHRRLMDGLSDEAGRLKTRPNFTVRSDGARHAFVDPARVTHELSAWLEQFNADPGDAPATERAAELYYRFETIHPFADGNGRVGRVLLAYWLYWRARLALRFHASDRLAHLDALEAANDGDLRPLAQFVDVHVETEP